MSGQPATPTPIGAVHDDVAQALITDAQIQPWFDIRGDNVVAYRRGSSLGGSLIFLINVEDRTARTKVTPSWGIYSAKELLSGADLSVNNGSFKTELASGQVAVIHCEDALA